MTGLSYDEAVHTYIGATLITVAALGALFVDRPGSPVWRQHAWLGFALFLGWIVMGPTEWFIRRRPEHPVTRYLRWVAPVALATVAVIFVIHRPNHRGHDHMMAMDPAAMQAELYQHWVFAAAFLAASITAFLSRFPATSPLVPPRVWYAFMALGGLVFLTFRV